MREGFGHRHQGVDLGSAGSVQPVSMGAAGEPGGVRQHTDQLPKQSTGHLQHLSGHTHLLRLLHHVSAHLLRHLV